MVNICAWHKCVFAVPLKKVGNFFLLEAFVKWKKIEHDGEGEWINQ